MMDYSLSNPPAEATHYSVAEDFSVTFYGRDPLYYKPHVFDPESRDWVMIGSMPEHCKPLSGAFGGAAFGNTGGMSLRDYFAAKAMAGMICGGMCDGSRWENDAAEKIANAAFIMADAMLAERAK